ncbi:MAG: serine--tRNA ligase [Candidatus Pacebacteria bacterium]|nr:serine--tRNA ligase [Candidatus Paceibacterota bacterium]
MLDIKFIRENIDIVKHAAQKKHVAVDLDRLLVIDDKRKELQQSYDAVRAIQNEASDKIARASPEERLRLIDEVRTVKDRMQKTESELKEVMKEWQLLMVQVPNVPDMSVPEGDDDSANVEVRTWGTPPEFTFKPKNHIDLMLALDMVELERGTKTAGFRGYYLKNDGARLSFALWQYALDTLHKKGFSPLIAPSLVRREPFIGTGYLPQSEEDLYKTQDGEFLAGTAEVATMSYFADEVLERSQLPMKFASFSPCFRREAGSHGKDTRGLIRVHEFYKVEQVVLCEASHQTSVDYHEELTQNAEELMQALRIPYHVVVNCGGDLGLGQVKKYDIEAWVPSEGTFRETHSASYFHDFQTRRLNIRYKDVDGKLRFVHSLNNTAIATPRVLVPLIENHQEEDGSIRIPEPLRPYMGKERIEVRT